MTNSSPLGDWGDWEVFFLEVCFSSEAAVCAVGSAAPHWHWDCLSQRWTPVGQVGRTSRTVDVGRDLGWSPVPEGSAVRSDQAQGFIWSLENLQGESLHNLFAQPVHCFTVPSVKKLFFMPKSVPLVLGEMTLLPRRLFQHGGSWSMSDLNQEIERSGKPETCCCDAQSRMYL